MGHPVKFSIVNCQCRVWILRKFSFSFRQRLRKSNTFSTKSHCTLFSQNFLSNESKLFVFQHCAVCNYLSQGFNCIKTLPIMFPVLGSLLKWLPLRNYHYDGRGSSFQSCDLPKTMLSFTGWLVTYKFDKMFQLFKYFPTISPERIFTIWHH